MATTARWVAVARARESQRADHLFEDPWAEALAGEGSFVNEKEPATAPGPGGDPNVVIRTRFFDDFALGAVSDREVRQVVLVAAGLDTRAFRLAWPEGIHLYELDRPGLLEYKNRVLADAGAQPGCTRHVLGVDMADDWTGALQDVGFRAGRPSCWLAEGFLVYLDGEAVRAALRRLSGLAAAGSRLGLDVPNRAFFTSAFTRPVVEQMEQRGTPYRFATDEPEALLADFGWASEVTRLGEENASYGRWPYPVLARGTPGVPGGFLVTATRIG